MPRRTAKKSPARIKKRKKTIDLPTEKTLRGSDIKDLITLWFGQPGIGKTSFVNGLFDRVLFLSTDRGTRFLDAMAVEIDSYEDVDTAINSLEALDECPYDAICIDFVDDLCVMIEAYVCQENNIESLSEMEWGAGWKAYKDLIRGTIARIKALDCGIVFIAHEEVKEMKDRVLTISRTQAAMPRSSYNLITGMADIIGYCSNEKVNKKGQKTRYERTVRTEPTETLHVKDRSNRTPRQPYDPLDGPMFIETFSKPTRRKKTTTKKKVSRRRSR